jgi:formate dehydrogenase
VCLLRRIESIVDSGTLAGAGAHSYSAGDATGGSDEAARFKDR